VLAMFGKEQLAELLEEITEANLETCKIWSKAYLAKKRSTMNDLELKQRLAAKLPEMIQKFPHGNPNNIYFCWMDKQPSLPLVTEKEWNWIVDEVTKTMTAIQYIKFHSTLCKVVWGSPIEMSHTTQLIWNSTWQKRAEALAQIGVI
jgi:phenylpyruvate tautomerase PptA (4-oxalocrotonate tautomerase family)